MDAFCENAPGMQTEKNNTAKRKANLFMKQLCKSKIHKFAKIRDINPNKKILISNSYPVDVDII